MCSSEPLDSQSCFHCCQWHLSLSMVAATAISEHSFWLLPSYVLITADKTLRQMLLCVGAQSVMSVILCPLVSPSQLHYKLDSSERAWLGLVWKCAGVGGTGGCFPFFCFTAAVRPGWKWATGPEGQTVGSCSECLMLLCLRGRTQSELSSSLLAQALGASQLSTCPFISPGWFLLKFIVCWLGQRSSDTWLFILVCHLLAM